MVNIKMNINDGWFYGGLKLEHFNNFHVMSSNRIIGFKLWSREIEYELRGVKSIVICLILGVISNIAYVITPKSSSRFKSNLNKYNKHDKHT